MTNSAQEDKILLTNFFESIPPGQEKNIDVTGNVEALSQYASHRLSFPPIELYCTSSICNGKRIFSSSSIVESKLGSSFDEFIYYLCNNCHRLVKTYSVRGKIESRNKAVLIKFGEAPNFGPPTPSRLMSIVGSENEYYLKGRRAENQSMGIAAFAYYRRVVENQKNKILDEIIKVAEKLKADKGLIEELIQAKHETQFTKAIESIKHAIPQTLLLGGHNPLTLLHSALSEGIHAQTDEECLEFATSIRIVLIELVEKMANALEASNELDAAVSKLLKVHATKKVEKP